MRRTIETRRDFLKHASLALALPLAFGCRTNSSAQVSNDKVLEAIKANAKTDPEDAWWGARHAPADVSWKTALATDADKGERMIISGTIYEADGKTPAPNTLIYLYHTDIYGIYGRDGQPRHGRHRGWMLTNAQGKYQFESILPASYPNSTIAKHVHMTLTTRDRREDWVDSILFDGDKFLTTRDREIHRGGLDPVLKMVKGNDGILRGVRDLRLWI